MEAWASREATLKALIGLGFIPLQCEEGEPNVFLDSPKKDWAGPIIQISIYQCSNEYWCVCADGGWMAPVVWAGPKASWDKTDTTAEFVEWLNTHHPGWI